MSFLPVVGGGCKVGKSEALCRNGRVFLGRWGNIPYFCGVKIDNPKSILDNAVGL